MITRPHPQTGEPLGQFQYECLHITTGTRSTSWADFPRQYVNRDADAFALLERWNWQQPGVWLYRMAP